jgi:putative sigma-54 modulation protein
MNITARHFEIDPALEEHIHERLMTLKKYIDKVIDAHVILSVEKYRHIAEITLMVSGLTLASKEESDNMRLSVDRAVSKLERQVKRYKGKLTNHKFKKREPENVAVEEPEDFLDYAEAETEEDEGSWQA